MLSRKMKYITAFLLSLCFFSFQKKHITVYMVGDSTMANKQAKAFPETGWGMPFAHVFDNTVTVDNRAMNGRSTKSFINEKRWEAVTGKLQEDDYVLIQFGHNDEKIDKPEVGTSLEEFKTNLVKYVQETRAAKAYPVLLTPVNRRNFDKEGHFKDTHMGYPDVVRAVAKEYNVPLIDMYNKTQQLLEKLGPDESTKLFNQLEPGVSPNYPNGVKDNTHFSEYGAQVMSQLAVEGIRELQLPLAKRLIDNKEK